MRELTRILRWTIVMLQMNFSNMFDQVKISAQYLREKLTGVQTTIGEALTTVRELENSGSFKYFPTFLNFVFFWPWKLWTLFVFNNWNISEHLRLTVKSSLPEVISDFFVTVSSEKCGDTRPETVCDSSLSHLMSNSLVQTYCFTSRLGSDIRMTELMAEPKIGFFFPKQLL